MKKPLQKLKLAIAVGMEPYAPTMAFSFLRRFLAFFISAVLLPGLAVCQTFTSTPVTAAQVGTAYAYSAFATDPSNRPLTFTATTLPSWLTFSPNGQNTATAFGTAVTSGIGGVAGDAAGNIYLADNNGTKINKIAPDGTTSLFATKTAGYNYGLVVVGNYLYISYYIPSSTIYVTRIALDNPAAGEQVVYQASPNNGGVLSMVEHGGYLYCAAYTSSKIIRIRLSDFQVTDYITSGIPVYGPFGLGFTPSGDLYIATWSNGKILKWDGTTLTTALTISGSSISDIKIDNNGYVYVSLYGSGIRKYTPDFSSFVTVAAGTAAWGMSLTPTGALVFGNGTRAYKVQTGAVLTGTPAIADIGVHNVVLAVSNGTTSTSQSFDITVMGPPTISHFNDTTSHVGAAPFALHAPVSNSAGSFTYTSSDPAVATIVGDTVTIVGAGTTTITATQAADGLYSSGTITAHLTVSNTTDPVITFNDISKTYGDAAFTLSPGSTSSGTFTYTTSNPAVATISGNTVNIVGQGTAIITANQAAVSGYNALAKQATLTVSKAAISITADAKSKTYGQADPALTYQITSGALVSNDSFTGSLTRDIGENAGTYAINQGTLALNSNYSLTFAGANLTVNKAAISITADAKSKTYGQADPALTYQITSGALVGNDTFTGSLTRDAGENAGTYAINQGTLALNNNYSLTFAGANLTVNKAAISITADAKSKTYGQADPALTYQITSGALVGTDKFTGSLTRDAGENAGTYAINQGTLALGSNYSITYTGSNLNITPVSRTLSFNALPLKTYGNPDFAPGATLSSGEAVVYSSSNTNVATIVNGNIHIVGAGNATITASAPSNVNYTAVAPVSQLIFVSKANQTITFAAIPDQLSGGKYDLSSVTSSAGLPVTFSTADPSIAVVTGTKLNLLAIGTTRVIAAAAGNANYNDATVVVQQVKVNNEFMDEIVVRRPVSPNGDGINEFLYIEGIKDHPENKVTLVDPSGVKVFEIKNYDNASRVFNGRSNVTGALLRAGTYFFLVEVNDGGTLHRKTGYILLKY